MRLTPSQITEILSENISADDMLSLDQSLRRYQRDPLRREPLFRVMRRVMRDNDMDPWNDPDFDDPEKGVVPWDEDETKRGHLDFLLGWFKDYLIDPDASLEWKGMSDEEANKHIDDFMKWWEHQNKREKTKAVRTIDSILEIDDMKITKKELNKIIREELQGLTIKEERGIPLTSKLENSLTNFWRHLNGLLKTWRPETDEGNAYYNDLETVMRDHALEGPDEPTPGGQRDGGSEAVYETGQEPFNPRKFQKIPPEAVEKAIAGVEKKRREKNLSSSLINDIISLMTVGPDDATPSQDLLDFKKELGHLLDAHHKEKT